MKIYEDIFTNDEIFSDSFKADLVYDGVAYEIQSKQLKKKKEQFTVYKDSEEFAGKKGEGREEEEEAAKAPEEVEEINDFIDSTGFQETPFNKATWGKYIKDYLKQVLEHLQKNKPDRVDAFKNGAKELTVFVMNNFDKFTFYTPKSGDGSSVIPMSYYKNEGDAPTFLIFRDGLREVKV